MLGKVSSDFDQVSNYLIFFIIRVIGNWFCNRTSVIGKRGYIIKKIREEVSFDKNQ